MTKLNSHLQFNFVGEKVSDADVEWLMQPDPEGNDGQWIKFPESWTMAHIMHAAGIFPSVTQAKKNGWDKPISHGFSDFVVTKQKIKIYILNTMLEPPYGDEDEYETD
jgi:hypothetical protein